MEFEFVWRFKRVCCCALAEINASVLSAVSHCESCCVLKSIKTATVNGSWLMGSYVAKSLRVFAVNWDLRRSQSLSYSSAKTLHLQGNNQSFIDRKITLLSLLSGKCVRFLRELLKTDSSVAAIDCRAAAGASELWKC